MRIYFDFNDWWIGYYRGPNKNYICLIPTVVISWLRKRDCDGSYSCPSVGHLPGCLYGDGEFLLTETS